MISGAMGPVDGTGMMGKDVCFYLLWSCARGFL
jgi:hypothetical protein